MTQKQGEAIIWIVIILINLLLLAGSHGGRGSDYQEYQTSAYEESP